MVNAPACWVLLVILYCHGVSVCQPIDRPESSDGYWISGSIDSLTASKEFAMKWYSGSAEINRYELHQMRYGEMRSGNAFLIFVTEPWNTARSVKADVIDSSNSDQTVVMKCNAIRKFQTGVYPYSTMTSSFIPLFKTDHRTLKVTASVQEWCGHVFSQLNSRGDSSTVTTHSYFEKDADTVFTMSRVWTEDEVLALARLSPQLLPKGEIKMVQSLTRTRMRHSPLRAENVSAHLDLMYPAKQFGADSVLLYSLDFPETQVTVRYFIERKFPFSILGWEEVHSPFYYGDFQGRITTSAVLKKSLMSEYWKHNHNSDEMLLREFEKDN